MDIINHFKKYYNMSPYLNISSEEWVYLNETYEKDDIRNELTKVCMSYELPYLELTEMDAYIDFLKLKSIRSNELITNTTGWSARLIDVDDYSMRFDDEYKIITRSLIGNKCSNYFQQENRWKTDGQHPSLYKTWTTFKFLYSALNGLWTLEYKSITKTNLRNCIQLRKFLASQFKPSVAKSLYDYFEAETILDFSIGWGDRLAGFYASNHGKHYIGLDPNERNHKGYNDQSKFYSRHLGFFEHYKTADFHMSPAEDFDYTQYHDSVDLVFTSPPSFDTEKYSDDTTQSWVRYKDIDSWNTDFLHKALTKIWKTLKADGILAINIADISTGSSKAMKICRPMNDFISSLDNSEFLGMMGMEMSIRPNLVNTDWKNKFTNSTEETEFFAEPIFIWKKSK